MTDPVPAVERDRVVVVGASGYIGGELLRLLLAHDFVEVVAATSTRFAGKRVDTVHPNLRARTELSFSRPAELPDHDVAFLATPHGTAAALVAELAGRSSLLLDLSADFRLREAALRRRYYPDLAVDDEALAGFVPGLPELYRDRLTGAHRISVPGCMATAGILALHPLARAGLVRGPVTVDARTGSSGSGTTSAGSGSSHAERAAAVRVFAPAGHRHEAEMSQATGLEVRMSATGIPAVRGVQVVCRLAATEPVDERAVRAAFRAAYADEPFVRIVAHRRGTHRLPDPSILYGANYTDVGFAVSPDGAGITAIAALDNLVKGGAGNAVQCLNVARGWPETTGLDFAGLHPV